MRVELTERQERIIAAAVSIVDADKEMRAWLGRSMSRKVNDTVTTAELQELFDILNRGRIVVEREA